MPTLHSTLTTLATNFANDVVSALGKMSLDELLAETSPSGRPTRTRSVTHRQSTRVRRTAADIEVLVGRVVDLLNAERTGMRAENLRVRLGVARKDLPMALTSALMTKKIKKTGQKRATKYFISR
jgi:hypothetical protein